jgi:hypothetical protein
VVANQQQQAVQPQQPLVARSDREIAKVDKFDDSEK